MVRFNEQQQIDSVRGALALRSQIEPIVDQFCRDGYRNICWLGIGGTWASCLQAEVHMREKSALDFYVINAAEYCVTGDKRVGEGTVVIISSVTGTAGTVGIISAPFFEAYAMPVGAGFLAIGLFAGIVSSSISLITSARLRS